METGAIYSDGRRPAECLLRTIDGVAVGGRTMPRQKIHDPFSRSRKDLDAILQYVFSIRPILWGMGDGGDLR